MTDDVSKTKCLKCNLNFTSEKTLKIHQLEKHPQNVVKCFKCGLRFSNQERFRVHWNTKHVTAPKTAAEPKPSTCSNEETVISDDESESSSQKLAVATTNKRKHVMPTSNRCTRCFKAFASQSSAKVHYERVHMDWTTECEVCKKHVKKNLYTNVHLRKHRLNGEITVERILQIQKENQKKKSPKLGFNVKVQPNVPSICPDCHKVFISYRVMKIHWARVHHVSANKANAEKQRDNIKKVESDEQKEEPTSCPQCNKIFNTKGRMKIHYFQAHVKKTVSKPIRKKKKIDKENDKEEPKACPQCNKIFSTNKKMKIHCFQAHVRKIKPIRKEKKVEKGNIPCATYPSIKSLSDLRSKPPDIDFNSNTCPVCKKVFVSNVTAKHHYKVVHRKEQSVKCPYPQCFSTCSTVGNLRMHFSKSHPTATLPKELEARVPSKKQKIEDKNNSDKLESNEGGKIEEQRKEEDTEKANETKAVKPGNPLLKMFEKMREKNAQCPVVPLKMSSEVIEIEEDQSEDTGCCFTLDFEHCSMCDKNFPNKEATMMHYNNKHPDELQMCAECGMLITNTRQLHYHFKIKHPFIVMPLFLKSSRAFGFTKELFDQFKLNKCTTCKLTFDSMNASQRHYIEEHEQKFEICSICLQSFRTEALLLTHWVQNHADSNFVEFQAQTTMEVDNQSENAVDTTVDSVIEIAAENSSKNDAENATKDTTKPDDAPITDSNIATPIHSNNTRKATKNNSKQNHRMIYPFITSDVCPMCGKQYSARKSAVIHYKFAHLKNGIRCKRCNTLFANVDHLKAHWLQVHQDAPWMEPTDKKLCQKTPKDVIEDKTDEMKNDSKQQNDSVEISPKLNVVVSLVNIKDNLDSLSPEMREQFLELSRDMDTVAIDSHSTENDEKVPDSGHGSTADTTDEEISVNSSQNEPLDLSVQHERDSNDDLLDLTLIKCETVHIKYESSDGLVSSFDQTIPSGHTKTSALANGTDIIVKDEITIEEPMIEE